jgi:enterochelin esterase family protein
MAQQIKLYAMLGGISPISCHRLSLLASLLLLIGTATWAQERVDSSRTVQETRVLELGKPIERELAGGEVHAYQIKLAAGQFLHAVVEQRGIDIVATLSGPDGKQVIEVDSPNGMQGPEEISVVTEAVGTYRLEVRSLEKEAAPGHYQLRIAEIHEASAQEKNLYVAGRAFAEAERLSGQGTAKSQHLAIEKYKETLPL